MLGDTIQAVCKGGSTTDVVSAFVSDTIDTLDSFTLWNQLWCWLEEEYFWNGIWKKLNFFVYFVGFG